MIVINQVTKKRTNKNRSKIVLDDVSCTIKKNKITALIGKSGAGKTTLLRCIAGLEILNDGMITVSGISLMGVPPSDRASFIGFVFQNYSLFANLTALENCTQPLMVVKGFSRIDAEQQAQKMLTLFGVENFRCSYPRELSGGQQQRVALARTMCMEPAAILLDEPTSALDGENTKILQAILKNLCTRGITVLLSSQDHQFVKDVAEQLVLLENGKIVEQTSSNASTLDAASKIAQFLQ